MYYMICDIKINYIVSINIYDFCLKILVHFDKIFLFKNIENFIL